MATSGWTQSQKEFSSPKEELSAPLTISVASTSFLLPGNQGWREFAQSRPVSFCEAGSFAETLLTDHHSDCLVAVLFLSDLVTIGENPDRNIEMVIEPLATALSTSPGRPIIAAYSTYSITDTIPLTQARSPAPKSRLNEQLYRLASNYPALHLLDLDATFSTIGLEQAFSFRNYYACWCRLSSKGISALASALCEILHRIEFPPSKVLVLDCDDTLWGGAVGELGWQHIVLGGDGTGKAFADFQRVVRWLNRKGTLVAIASKNELGDVLDCFENHPEMQLKPEDIAVFQVGWHSKVESLQRIAQELSLGLDSLVFWDNCPLERGLIRSCLPEVTVPEPPPGVWDWPARLARLPNFAGFFVTDDDRARASSYRVRKQFQEEAKRAVDYTTYLSTVAMKPTLEPLSRSTLDRALQLCQKTNQFNLRVHRYGKEELLRVLSHGQNLLWTVRLQDKFGDHGIVGLVFCIPGEEASVHLDTFLLSCRVLGRTLESWVIAQAFRELRESGHIKCIAEFVPREKNGMVRDFLIEHGFRPSEVSQEKEVYEADLTNYCTPNLEVFTSDA